MKAYAIVVRITIMDLVKTIGMIITMITMTTHNKGNEEEEEEHLRCNIYNDNNNYCNIHNGHKYIYNM